jgi:hypothetical protein
MTSSVAFLGGKSTVKCVLENLPWGWLTGIFYIFLSNMNGQTGPDDNILRGDPYLPSANLEWYSEDSQKEGDSGGRNSHSVFTSLGCNGYLPSVIYTQPKDQFSQEWPLKRKRWMGTRPGAELASRELHNLCFSPPPSRSKYKPTLWGQSLFPREALLQ